MKKRRIFILLFPILFIICSDGSAQTVSNVYFTGNFTVGSVLTGIYTTSGITDEEISLNWYRISPGVLVASGTTDYTIMSSDLGKNIYFKVLVLDNLSGDTISVDSSAVSPAILANKAPVASSQVLLGDLFIGRNIFAVYNYSDLESDPENKSLTEFVWYRATNGSGAGATSVITNHTGTYLINAADAGKYIQARIKPYAQSGTTAGTQVQTTWYGPVNSIPYADNVTITGAPKVDSTLTGDYDFHDADIADDEGTSLFQWYRGSTAIPFANSLTYVLTKEDVDLIISFEVTPVSSSEYPNTGSPVKVSLTETISDPGSTLPDATDICISGIRSVGEELTGKYKYLNSYDEKNSIFLWLTGTTVLKSGTTDAYKRYIIKSADVKKEIVFAVIPKNKRSEVGDTVFSETLALFTLPRESFSIADDTITLTAKPLGGIFYGEGVSYGKFLPFSLNYLNSPFTVNYQLNINYPDYSCQQNISTELEVKGIDMYFDSFRNLYCQNGGYDTIYVKSIPKDLISAEFKMTDPNGIFQVINDSVLIIDPGRMSAGNKEDTLRFIAYTAGSPNPITIFRPFVIDAITQVSILNLDTGALICNNISPYELSVSNPGGVFAGPVDAVTGVFNPSLAMGNTQVKYTFTTTLGCVSSVTVPIIINPSPVVSFAAADSCIESKSDTTRFINYTVSVDPVTRWKWEFLDDGRSDTVMSPGHLYKTGGWNKVVLSATTNKNCITRYEATIDLGIKPEADFYWKSECFHPGESLMLFDSTPPSSQIISRSWNFFDGDSLHTVKNTKYPKKVGYLPVEYIVRTKYRNCHDTVFKNIFIRPTVSLASDDYFWNFENGKGGWEKDYEIKNYWSFGKPDRTVINSAASGDSAWFTNYLPVNQKPESYSVISPCFDFSASDRPMIRLKLWKRFDRNRDGAVLQYKIGDASTWQAVGTLDDGINWYNSTLIKGRPGGDQTGWTSVSQDTKWMEARHTLDELKGSVDVKFRIAYGSDGTSQDNEGIAFDDIWIGERTRHVLLEHFANSSDVRSSEATAMVNTIALNNQEDVINIQYHTNFPGSDPFYDNNPGDAGARILFYGLIKAPYSFIDGGSRKDFANIFDYNLADIDGNDVIRRSLINPLFDISLNSTVSGGILTISGQLTALEDINSDNLNIYLAVTEKENNEHTGANGETVFYNVFRKFIPDAGGISLKNSWTKGESYTMTEKTWKIDKRLNSADIEVIAFVQNNVTKELYQAVSEIEQNLVVGIENLFQGKGTDFAIYPNPAIDKLTITFEKPLVNESDIRIYNLQGIVIAAYKAGSGLSEYTIENTGLRGGIYLVRVSSAGKDLGYRKLIISGD